jgi:hypothetical protein
LELSANKLFQNIDLLSDFSDDLYWSKHTFKRSKLFSAHDDLSFATCKLEWSRNLIRSHRGQLRPEMNTLLRQLSSVASSLTEFAKSQFAFNTLNQDDQTVLLNYNVPLYLQYVTAKYFSAKTGLEQLNWILEGQDNNLSGQPETNFIRISLAEYNVPTPFFSSPEQMDRYSDLCEKVSISLTSYFAAF